MHRKINLRKEQLNRWSHTRKMGKRRFVIVWGIGFAGGLSVLLGAIIICILIAAIKLPLIIGVILFILYVINLPLITYRFGCYFWDMMEDAFRRMDESR